MVTTVELEVLSLGLEWVSHSLMDANLNNLIRTPRCHWLLLVIFRGPLSGLYC